MALALLLAPFASALAADMPAPRRGTGLPVPRHASLRNEDTNVRTGPNSRHPIDWVYKRRGMPVEIVAEYDNWRKIRDWQGAGGWVHLGLLTGKRHVVVTGPQAVLRKTPSPQAAEVARIEQDVIAQIKTCSADWCRVQAGPHVGWIERHNVWGVYKGETIN